MSQIKVSNLTFSYDTNYENIFENVSFEIDTDWRLGFIGRNGRGKTTFLNLLQDKYKYSGVITSSARFDYFPFEIKECKPKKDQLMITLDEIDELKNTNTEGNTLNIVKNIIAPFSEWEEKMNLYINENTEESMIEYGKVLDLYMSHDGYIIDELIEKEIRKLDVGVDVLKRSFNTLSSGERTKLMLAALFLKKNNFLLIDEPTNHLDIEGRESVARYLNSKKGFILVSHDRYFIDKIVDHIISINKNDIEIQKGDFTSWNYNRELQDNYEIAQNDKLKKEIKTLTESFRRSKGWSDLVEKSKIGEHVYDRGAVGAQAARMMKKAKNVEHRREKAIEEKKKLLKNIEKADDLKIIPQAYLKNNYINIDNLSISYGDKKVCDELSFTVNEGDRVALRGKNGSGKSSIIKLILGEDIEYTGSLNIGNQLSISYISQDTSHLRGSFKEFVENEAIDESLFRAILSKLDFNPNSIEKDLSDLSAGQKKKVLIAKSLSQKANLYIWDEPLNYIDVISRMQIERLILEYKPTMIFVEHDYMFNENIATKAIKL
jgi:lincosamide and streptogramin A transport system ATP-binding/permease protein